MKKFFTRRRFLQALGVAALITIGIYAYASTITPHRLQIEHVRIAIPGLAPRWEGCRIVLLSDLHAGPRVSMKHIERALQMSAGLQPDFLCIAGDIIDNTTSHLPQLCDILTPITAKITTYAVMGNHDIRSESADTMSTMLQQAGVQMLRNELRATGSEPGDLCFVGLDDKWAGSMDPKILEQAPKDATIILLSHNPDSYENVAKYRWHLMLSGHTHGGQVCIPGIGPLILPTQHRDRAAGLFHPDPKQPHRALYVTRGVGHLLKVRLFCPPEITCITLERTKP